MPDKKIIDLNVEVLRRDLDSGAPSYAVRATSMGTELLHKEYPEIETAMFVAADIMVRVASIPAVYAAKVESASALAGVETEDVAQELGDIKVMPVETGPLEMDTLIETARLAETEPVETEPVETDLDPVPVKCQSCGQEDTVSGALHAADFETIPCLQCGGDMK